MQPVADFTHPLKTSWFRHVKTQTWKKKWCCSREKIQQDLTDQIVCLWLANLNDLSALIILTVGGIKKQLATPNHPVLCHFHASAANRGIKEESVLTQCVCVRGDTEGFCPLALALTHGCEVDKNDTFVASKRGSSLITHTCTQIHTVLHACQTNHLQSWITITQIRRCSKALSHFF